MKQNIFIFFRLEKGNAVDLELSQCAAVEFTQQVVQMLTQFVIESREELRDLFLCNGRCEVNIPGGQAGERFRVAREQAVQECGAAAKIPQDEKRLFNSLRFVSWKKNIIQKEKEPMHELPNGPDCIKKQEKNYSFAGEAGGCIL